MVKYKTEQRKKLVELISRHNHHSFSAQDIFSEIGSKDISMSAIYRNLAELEDEGIICKVSDKKRAGTLFQYVNPKSCRGIIHLKCEECDNTYHLTSYISKMIFDMAEDEFNFKTNNSSAFLYGKCEECLKK